MKNKKILALLCLLLLVTSLVLPLCSFVTTTFDTQCAYEPLINSEVGYTYNNNGNIVYGSIPNYNRILMPDSYSDINPNNVSFVADSYSIRASSPAMRIVYSSFASGKSSLSSNDMLRMTIECTGGNETQTLDFNYHVKYSGVLLPSTVSNNYIEFNTISEGSSYKVSGEANYNVTTPNLSVLSLFIEFEYVYVETDLQLDLSRIYNSLVADIKESISSDYTFVNISYIDCQYSYRLGDQYIPITSDSFTMVDRIYSIPSKEAILSEQYKELWYSRSYTLGYNAGVSQAPDVWGSFSKFLSSTIGGFLDMKIVPGNPGVTISGILSVILSISLVILFLRLFAGG